MLLELEFSEKMSKPAGCVILFLALPPRKFGYSLKINGWKLNFSFKMDPFQGKNSSILEGAPPSKQDVSTSHIQSPVTTSRPGTRFHALYYAEPSPRVFSEALVTEDPIVKKMGSYGAPL